MATTLFTTPAAARRVGAHWRPTLTDGVWMNVTRDRWLSQRRSTGTWTETDVHGNEVAEYRPSHFEVQNTQQTTDCGDCAAHRVPCTHQP